ncbi:MAG: FAD-dependent oxidoreductase / Rieske-type iron-sulfur protein [Ilumatobacteraceae bacterium]|nr:FAD-dependent oxidoreductase / Rieske-type iron-sulfur protein [Ilumatobacteraceae bacterium]
MADHVEGTEHYDTLEAFARDRVGIDVQHRWSAFDWDCPCHGSRFEFDGTVLDGAASQPLEPVQLPLHSDGTS